MMLFKNVLFYRPFYLLTDLALKRVSQRLHTKFSVEKHCKPGIKTYAQTRRFNSYDRSYPILKTSHTTFDHKRRNRMRWGFLEEPATKLGQWSAALRFKPWGVRVAKQSLSRLLYSYTRNIKMKGAVSLLTCLFLSVIWTEGLWNFAKL